MVRFGTRTSLRSAPSYMSVRYSHRPK
jgi:hypothetical protein